MPDIQTIINYLQSNKLDLAVTECLSLIQQQPNNADLQQLLGVIYGKSGKLNSAIQAFKQAIKLDPKQAVYHNNISNAYKLSGNFELALRHLNEALLLAPNNSESHNNLASLYYSQGQIVQALPIYEKAIRLNPNSWEAHYNLANCYIKTDMVLQAISHYQTAIKLNPGHTDAKLNLAMAYVSLKDYTSALPYLIEAAVNNPEHAELQGHLAEAYLDLGRAPEAITQYITALKLQPERAEWHHNLAVLYLRNKQLDQAKLHFATSLSLQPNNPTARHMLNALETNTQPASAPSEYVTDLFDQYAGYYNKHVSGQLNYSVPQLLRQAVGKYITDATKTLNVLDLGCGTGLCGIYFRDLANFLIGVDLSSQMLAQARMLGAYDGLCRANILDTIPGYNLKVFDLVIAADVFVYIGDLSLVFKYIVSALRAPSKIAFTIENLKDEQQNYVLQNSGRYAHSIKYIAKICDQFGLNICTMDQVILRKNNDHDINGLLYILEFNHTN